MKNIVEKSIDKMLDNKDLAILMAAGCELLVDSKINDDGSATITFKSKYPVAIKRDKNGIPIDVIELKA